jgi:hypothetical protein
MQGNVGITRRMENTSQGRPAVAAKSAQRSRVSNGRLLPTDLRSATARRFRDLYHDICADLGGPEYLSTGELQLVRRASMLSAECERQEALAAQDDVEFDCDAYVTKTNALKARL